MALVQTQKQPQHKNTATLLRERRNAALDELSTARIFGYLALRHRVFLLTFALIMSNMGWVVLQVK